MFHTLPASLPSEIAELEEAICRFQQGEIDAETLKTLRVAFGIYEQRKDKTYMVRVRLPGGSLTPRQFRSVAQLAQSYGSEALHLTTRQALQIHDVAIENLIPILRQLHAAGLSTRGGGGNTVRNIIAPADAGVACDEAFDVSPYVFSLTDRLTAKSDSWTLPRKYKIAFGSNEQDAAGAMVTDLGFIAQIRGGVPGFSVYVAGGQGGRSAAGQLLHEFIRDNEVYYVAEAVKRLFSKYGDRSNRHAARTRFLWKTLGETEFRRLYQQEFEQLHSEGVLPLSLPSSDRLLRDTVNTQQPDGRCGRTDHFERWRRRFVLEQKQNGFYIVLIPIFLGQLPNAAALSLTDFLLPLGEDVVRLSTEQNVLLRNIPESMLPQAFELSQEIAPLSSGPRLLGLAVACTGAATCRLGICLSRGALDAVVRRLQASDLELDRLSDFRIHISGCPNSCGAHWTADLGFFGRVARTNGQMYPAYEVVAGGKRAGTARLSEPIGAIPARGLPMFVEEGLRRYLGSAESGGFNHWLDHGGKQDLAALCEQYRCAPPEDNDDFYRDWESDEPFSRVRRGTT